MSARSATIKLQNKTKSKLSLTGAKLSHGVWSENQYPPESIEAGGSGTWESESDGFMTGTQGSASYHLVDSGTVTVSWDNPYAGSNSYSDSAPKGFTISRTGGSGDNAVVTFTLTPAVS